MSAAGRDTRSPEEIVAQLDLNHARNWLESSIKQAAHSMREYADKLERDANVGKDPIEQALYAFDAYANLVPNLRMDQLVRAAGWVLRAQHALEAAQAKARTDNQD